MVHRGCRAGLAMNEQKLTIEQARDACVDSFATFCRLMQDDGYFDETHEKLCMWTQAHIEKLERQVQVRGTCTGKLAYVMPRGSLKSTIVTKHLNNWLVVRNYYKHKDDTTRILIAGNTHTNSKKKLQGIRGMYDVHELFKSLFPDILPKKGRDGSKWSDESACINRKSSFDESTFEIGSMKTKLTGRHYNVICEDDTTAPDADDMSEDMTRPSTETIDKAIGFHQASMPLFVPKGFRLSIVVSTRWAMIDLISKIQDENYNIFDVPAEVDGEPVFTFAYDKETLSIIKDRVGDYMYSCLYLNKPLDDSLRVFRSTDMEWIDKEQLPQTGSVTIAVDPAISERDEACESAITVDLHELKQDGSRYEYWLEDMHGHMLPFDLAEKTLALADKYDTPDTPVRAIIIEQEAYQAALKYIIIDMMNKRKGQGKKTYQIVKAKRGNKKVRIEGMQPAFQRHRVKFVRGALSDQTESQLLQWPMGKLVDIIDSWSMHRKVWRSEKFDEPVEPKEKYVEDFETVYNEIVNRKKDSAGHGLMAGVVTDIGQGLTPDGSMYYEGAR